MSTGPSEGGQPGPMAALEAVTPRAGGEATIYWQIEAQTKKDLLLMESIAMP